MCGNTAAGIAVTPIAGADKTAVERCKRHDRWTRRIAAHIRVFFVFHLNTVSKSNKPPTKIAPPALGGGKVGVLAAEMHPIGTILLV
jgi:hypothetical protein